MNTLTAEVRATIRQYLDSKVGIRHIERMTGIHRDTVMRMKRERTFVDQRSDGICRAISQPKRVALWGKDIPEGKRLGWTCSVQYCGNPEHFVLAENKAAGWRSYKAERAKVESLNDGEYVDFPDEPTDEKSVLKFRTSLLAPLGWNHFLIRTIPNGGGVRVVRAGEYYQDKKEQRAEYRVLTERMHVWLNCAICEQAFLVNAASHETRKYCSNACWALAPRGGWAKPKNEIGSVFLASSGVSGTMASHACRAAKSRRVRSRRTVTGRDYVRATSISSMLIRSTEIPAKFYTQNGPNWQNINSIGATSIQRMKTLTRSFTLECYGPISMAGTTSAWCARTTTFRPRKQRNFPINGGVRMSRR